MMPFRRTDGPLFEYACHEGNIGLHGILAGARNLERLGPRAASVGVPVMNTVKHRMTLFAGPDRARR